MKWLKVVYASWATLCCCSESAALHFGGLLPRVTSLSCCYFFLPLNLPSGHHASLSCIACANNTRKWDLGALELVQDEARNGYMQDICHASLSWGKNIGHMLLLLQLIALACPSGLSGASVSSLWGLLVLSQNLEHFLSSERAKKATESQGPSTAAASCHQSASLLKTGPT